MKASFERMWRRTRDLYAPRLDLLEQELGDCGDLAEFGPCFGEFIGSDYAMSLEEIAQELGISRQSVWQIEQTAIRKMRERFDEVSHDVRRRFK